MNQNRTYTFDIPTRAVGKQSVRVGQIKYRKDGQPYVPRYFPRETTNFTALVKMAAKQAGVQMMDRCRMDVFIYLPMTVKKHGKKPETYHECLVRPDRDNVNKSIGDALKGIAFADDKYIMEGKTSYRFIKGRQAFTRVMLWEVGWEEYIEETNGGTI